MIWFDLKLSIETLGEALGEETLWETSSEISFGWYSILEILVEET